jgi:ribosomal-protein-alanine N-acetyltransferase
MKTNYKTRKMLVEDLEAVLLLENSCFSVPWSKESFYKELTENTLAHYTVIEIDNKIVGYGGTWDIMDEGHITNIAVDPNFRQRGLGFELVKVMVDQAVKRKLNVMTLEVRKSNTPAIKLYEKLGFIIAGIRPKYYSDNQEDALIMWVTLDTKTSEA